MTRYEPPPGSPRKVIKVTDFRKGLSRYIAAVRYGDEWVCIQRKGDDPVYLVSQADFDFIQQRRDALLRAPKHPTTGKPTGKGLWQYLVETLRAERKASE